MEYTAGLSIITNCALMGLISNEMHVLLPEFIENMAVDGKRCGLEEKIVFLFTLCASLRSPFHCALGVTSNRVAVPCSRAKLNMGL